MIRIGPHGHVRDDLKGPIPIAGQDGDIGCTVVCNSKIQICVRIEPSECE